MEELIKFIEKFNADRDWQQYHTTNNLAKSIVLEANELLEHFQFDNNGDNIQEIKDELADVLAYCIDMCIQLKCDPIQIVYDKYKQNALKYPIEKAKGTAKKYYDL